MIYAYKYPEDVKGIILSGTYHWEGNNGTYHRKPYHTPVRSYKQVIEERGILLRQNIDRSISKECISIFKEIEMYTEAPAFETRNSFISAPVIDSLSEVNLPVLIFNGSGVCKIDCAGEYMNVFPCSELKTIEGACDDPWMSDQNFLRLPAIDLFLHTNSRRWIVTGD